jgi:hypothetical protein
LGLARNDLITHNRRITHRPEDLESQLHHGVRDDERGGRVSRRRLAFVEVEIPIGGDDSHGVEESDKGDRSGRLDGDADTVLSARRTFREALEEEDEHASEERGLYEAVEEDLFGISLPQM